MAEAGLEGYLAVDLKNVYYLTGFKDISDATLALVIPSEGKPHLWTYPLSYALAREQSKNCDVKKVEMGEKIHLKIAESIKEMRLTVVGFDKMDAERYLTLSSALPDVRLRAKLDALLNLRRVKSPDELKLIREAAELADIGVEAGIEAVKPGVHEYEVAAEIEYAMRRNGSEGVAFETIVASGPRSAFPHGTSTDRVIRRGEFVTMDLGAVHLGYRSDLTRTVVVGRPSDRDREIFETVLEAHEKAFEKMRAGVSGRDVDAAGREIIKQKGYGDKFIHGLGHGVGLEIHEPPRLSPTSEDILAAGNIVTDEPGIYIEGYGGVRIEDTVLVLDDGAERLTRAGKPLTA